MQKGSLKYVPIAPGRYLQGDFSRDTTTDFRELFVCLQYFKKFSSHYFLGLAQGNCGGSGLHELAFLRQLRLVTFVVEDLIPQRINGIQHYLS